MVEFVLHADDLGLSHGINETIIDSIETGAVRSVSLISNGHAALEATEYLKQRPDIRVSLHLNLQEGQPAAPADQVFLLTDAGGQLNTSFQSLVFKWLRADAYQRQALEAQIRLELVHQIRRAREMLGTRLDELRIDSHTHIHAIPFIFKSLLSIHDELRIDYIRLPREPFYLAMGEPGWHRAFGSNMLKHKLLNAFSKKMVPALKTRRITYNENLIGALYTGKMTITAIKEGIKACKRTIQDTQHGTPLVEVLIHPGRAHDNEARLWAGRVDLWRYYNSDNRQIEQGLAKKVATRAIFLG